MNSRSWACAKSIFRSWLPTGAFLLAYFKKQFSLSWRSRLTISRFRSRRSYELRGSFIRRIINNAQRVLRAIGAVCRLHPVSTLRCSRLTRQVQVPIVELWIRETCSIPTLLHTRGEQLQNYDISHVTLTSATTRAYESAIQTRGRTRKLRNRSVPFSLFLLIRELWFCQIERQWAMRKNVLHTLKLRNWREIIYLLLHWKFRPLPFLFN